MSHSSLVESHNEVLPFRRKWLERGLLFAVILASSVAMSHNVADPDLWGHIQYGRDALQNGLPATTSYSFTAEGYRWINHENLAELMFAVVDGLLGGRGLLALKFLIGVGVLVLILSYGVRQGLGTVAVCLVTLLVGVNLTRHWAVRPQLLSYLYYTILITLLAWSFQGWQGRWHLRLFEKKQADPSERLFYSARRLRYLWLAPILFVFWANSHGGFVAGLMIYVAYLGLRSLEALTCEGWKGLALVQRFAMMALVAVLATCINPYGPNLQLWLLESLTVPRPEITEWHPPNLLEASALPLWLAMLTWAVVMLFTRRSRDFTHLVILTLTLWQSLEHQRHVPFFIIPFAFWMAVHVESALCRFNISKKDTSFGEGMNRPLRYILAIGMCLAYGLLLGKLYERLKDMPVPRDQFPVTAVQYMADKNLEGKLVVTYNWAQYVIAALGSDDDHPGIRVAFDGRFRTCYPQEIVDMHFDLVLGDGVAFLRQRGASSGPFDADRVLEHGHPDLVLLNRFQPHSELVMYQNRDDWVLLYQDRMAQVWGRAAKYDDPKLATYIPPQQRNVSMTPQMGNVSWPALPKKYDPPNNAQVGKSRTTAPPTRT